MSVSAQRHAIMKEFEAFYVSAFRKKAKLAGVEIRKACNWRVEQVVADGVILRVSGAPFKPWDELRLTSQQYGNWLRSVNREKELNRLIVMKALGTTK